VSALNKIGGALLAAILLIAVITGLQTGSGQAVLSGVWNATASVVAWAGDQGARLGVGVGTAGNPIRSIIAGLVVFAGLTVLTPAGRSSRGIITAGVCAVVVALVLLQPGLGAAMRQAVGR
jgi:hypothetical protein